MACHYVTGPRGSGKSLFAVKVAFDDYLSKYKRVATNLDLFPDSFLNRHYDIVRVPDIPSAEHFEQIGLGCDKKYLTSKGYDDKKFGLIILDEISIFLKSKKDSEFSALMAWLVQSRKYGWDLILLAQNKEQVHDEVYLALCDHLVSCKADALVPIPYLGSILKKFGIKGNLPENYTALIFNGKSELNDVIETVSYSKDKYKLLYNTTQRFFKDVLYHNDTIHDMRAVYSLVPDYILSGQKLIDKFKDNIETIKTKVKNIDQLLIDEGEIMAVNHHQKQGLYIKFGLLALGLVAFLYFNNPLDNKLLNNVTGLDDVEQQSINTVQSNPQPLTQKPIQNNFNLSPENDFFQDLISGAEVSIPVYSENDTLKAYIQVKTETQTTFITLDDLRVIGWYALKQGNVVFLKKNNITIQIPLSKQTFIKEN